MMLDVVFSIFLLGTLASMVALIVLFYRVVSKSPAVLKEILDAWSGRRIAPVDSKSTGYNEIKRGPTGYTKVFVEDLPPEAIAPSLKKPPRPEGGFGSRVSEVDDST